MEISQNYKQQRETTMNKILFAPLPEDIKAEMLLVLDRVPPKYDRQGNLTQRARTKPTLENVIYILEHDPRISGSIRYCEFSDRVLLYDEQIIDTDITSLSLFLAQTWDMRTSKGDVVVESTARAAIIHVAHLHSFDPLKEYLEGLTWDQQPRLHNLLKGYFGCIGDEALLAEIGKRWAISCVARALKPGCKVDTVLCLQGAQGRKKSTAIRVLAGDDWFSDSHLDIRSKEAYQLIHSSGVWIWELAELQSLRTRDAENVKMFLSSQQDIYRKSYGRFPVQKKRRVVFAATTNPQVFLLDPTGSRRFWPCTVIQVQVDKLQADRDQIWAEAVHYFKTGEHWWLEPTEEHNYPAMLEYHQQQFTAADPWMSTAQTMLDRSEGCTVNEIMQALELPSHQQRKSTAMRITDLLQALGAKKQRITDTRQLAEDKAPKLGQYTVWKKAL